MWKDKNSRYEVVQKGTNSLILAGVDDQMEGKPDIHSALKRTSSNRCTLLLSHCPDYADEIKELPIDLQLSGHSHGGQIRFPLLGELSTPPYAQKYVQGLYQISDSALQVYTNRGIGTTILPIRFLCRPELTVIELVNV